ncbi:MAG: EFR1 family ferrodoxin [Clostridiales Family XIII bacterium]|jgi:ferredoxin|nr:EFR1 family ferrodoxin [Clostridiales Family XIII bacterium]
MNLSKIVAAFFSPTGNTAQIVMTVAKGLSSELALPILRINMTQPGVRKGVTLIPENSVLVMGFPVYAGRLPNLLLEYVSKLKGENVTGVPVVTYGNRNYDDGLMELRNVMENCGIKTVGAGAFVGEHSFSRLLAKGRPDMDDLRLAEELGRKAAAKINAGWKHERPIEVEGQEPIRPYYQPRDRNGNAIDIRKVKPKTDAATCVKCKLCAANCPMGSIDPENVFETAGICIKCCACEKNCPTGAKYFDDPGYLYHLHELEEVYSRRADSVIFV